MNKLAMVLVLVAGCGDDGANAPKDAAPPVADAGADAPPDAACFDNPQTNDEIINACTTAQKIFKPGVPPLLNPDGSLPMLPN